MTAAQGASAVARSSWAETRLTTSSTAEGSTAPIPASVETLWRNRSDSVPAESPGDQARTSRPASANCWANRWPMYPAPTRPTGPSSVRRSVTEPELVQRAARLVVLDRLGVQRLLGGAVPERAELEVDAGVEAEVLDERRAEQTDERRARGLAHRRDELDVAVAVG